MRCYLVVFLVAATLLVAYPAQQVTFDISAGVVCGNFLTDTPVAGCYVSAINRVIAYNQTMSSGGNNGEPCESYSCKYSGEFTTTTCETIGAAGCFNGSITNRHFPFCCYTSC